MKKLLLVLVLFAMVFVTGCLPDWFPGVPEPEPEVPELTVEVHAILELREDLWGIAYTIENTCGEHIYSYVVEFTLVYDTKWASVTQTVEGENLYPGKLDVGWKQLLIADEEPILLDEYKVVLE